MQISIVTANALFSIFSFLFHFYVKMRTHIAINH